MQAGRLRLLLLVLAAGCAPARAYEGPARPPAEVARIDVSGTGQAGGLRGEVSYESTALAVDGRRLARPSRVVEVLPGRHEIEVEWIRFEADDYAHLKDETDVFWIETGRGRIRVEVEAHAGKRYRLQWPAEWSGTPPHLKEVGGQ